jgi:hypothetical protein
MFRVHITLLHFVADEMKFNKGKEQVWKLQQENDAFKKSQ